MLAPQANINVVDEEFVLLRINFGLAQLARHQLSRSHNSVTFTKIDTQAYASNIVVT